MLHGGSICNLGYFPFQPTVHNWSIKGCGMWYPVSGKLHIKNPLLLIGKHSLCVDSRFPLRKCVTVTIWLASNSQWYGNQCALEASLNKTNFHWRQTLQWRSAKFKSSLECEADLVERARREDSLGRWLNAGLSGAPCGAVWFRHCDHNGTIHREVRLLVIIYTSVDASSQFLDWPVQQTDKQADLTCGYPFTRLRSWCVYVYVSVSNRFSKGRLLLCVRFPYALGMRYICVPLRNQFQYWNS